MVNKKVEGAAIITVCIGVLTFFVGLTEYIELQISPVLARMAKHEKDFVHHDALYHLLDERVRYAENQVQVTIARHEKEELD